MVQIITVLYRKYQIMLKNLQNNIRKETCPHCKGEGVFDYTTEYGVHYELCYNCNGTGEVRSVSKKELTKRRHLITHFKKKAHGK